MRPKSGLPAMLNKPRQPVRKGASLFQKRSGNIVPLFQWAQIHLNGSYHFTDVALEGDFRLLREYHDPRTRVSPGSERAESGAIPVQEEEELIPIQLSL